MTQSRLNKGGEMNHYPTFTQTNFGGGRTLVKFTNANGLIAYKE